MSNNSPEQNGEQGRLLREMNAELLVSSVRQHELTEIAEKAEANARKSEERVSEANRALTKSLDEVNRLNWQLDGSRRAALNLMEDAVRSRETTERLNVELHNEIVDRLASEKALRESRGALQSFYDSSPLLMGIAEVEGDTIYAAEANEATARFFGVASAAELYGRSADEVATPESNRIWLEQYGRSRDEGVPVHFELQYGDEDDPRWLSASAAYLGETAAGRSRFSFVAEDVTDRRRADERLRESDERLRIATEAAELGTWVWDLDSNQVYWNRRHFEMMGMEPQTGPIDAEAFFTRVHPDDRKQVSDRLERAIDKGAIFDAVFRVVQDDGRVRWMSGYGQLTRKPNGKPKVMSGVMLDITYRMEIEEDLRESSERMRLLVESATDVSIFTMDQKGVINSWNTGSERIYGWAEREVLGRNVDVLFTPEDRERDAPETEMRGAVEHGRALDERWHLRKDGTRFFASGLVQPLGDDGRQGFVKIARDMTERLRAEKAQQERERMQTLVDAQESERKRIARDLHDELGQQLTALRLKLDRVSIEAPEPLEGSIEEVKEIAKSIDEGVDFLAWELRPAALDDLGLIPALERYVKEWSNYSGVAAKLSATASADQRFDPSVETALYRIVQESLNNVNKHAHASNAEVTLRMRRGKVVLIVDDDGDGFDAEDPELRSRGIGLMGMRERVQMIGGTIEIESEIGHGTTLFVKAPIATH